MIVVHRILCPGTVGGDKHSRMYASSECVDSGKRRSFARASLIDRCAKHNRPTFETGVTNAGNSVAIYASENHVFFLKAEI